MSARPKNRIKIALPLYGHQSSKFLVGWLACQAQIARYDAYAGIVVTEQAPADHAMNEMIGGALKDPNWDYLLSFEHDMRMPEGWIERVGALDPATHPIVGALYFGKAQDGQDPIPGYWIKERLRRLTYEEVCTMLPERGGRAGLHRVDTVGMGCTAIHRSVFEQWPWSPSHPWFRFDYDHMGPIGHDVWFCVQAARQGYPIYLDSSMVAGHIGEWESNTTTYLATTEFARRAAPPQPAAPAQTPGVVVAHAETGLHERTRAAAEATSLPVVTVEVTADNDYHDVIAELWSDGETFVTLEPDIVPAPGQIEELAACPEPWCAFAYEYPPFGMYAGMGLAKFSRELLARFPYALSETGTWHDATHPAKHWCRVDGWLKQYLMERGVTQHIHGVVEHLHKGRPAHDCVTEPPLPRDIPSAITDEEAAVLAEIAKGKYVLEMGAHYGFSTVILARTARSVVSVDWHHGDPLAGTGDTEAIFRANLRSHGVEDLVDVRVGRFEDVLPALKGQVFEVIFLDGDHSREAVERDINLALPLLAPGGTLVFHDYGRTEPGFGVTDAVNEIMLQTPDRLVDTLAVYSMQPAVLRIAR